MNQPLFSIIIPTRERYQTLPYAMQSVLNQTYGNFELIIMDNFSSNETYKTVQQFDDTRIKYYRTTERLSMSDNWELGLSKTTGDYVFVLGDDDGLMPDALELASQIINNYQVSIISWLRYVYGWDSVIVPFLRNRLSIQTSQEVLLLDSKHIVKQYYASAIEHEYLPMIYNSFVEKDLVERIKSIHNRYFHTHAPDIASGVLNAYFSDSYLFSLRALSLTGVSGYSNGASTLFQKPNKDQSMNHYLRDEKKNTNEFFHPNFRVEEFSDMEIPFITEMSILDPGLCLKDLFFSNDKDIQVNFEAIIKKAANQINRNKHLYEITEKYLLLLAKKHGVLSLEIPKKEISENTIPLEPMSQGFYIDNNGKLNKIIINCEQLGVFDVARAAKLAQAVLPPIKNINVAALFPSPQGIKKADFNQKKNYSQIIIDGVFFQLYKTGIARVWKSLLEQWANTEFANHIIVLDRANTAPKINGIRYRTISPYNYNDTESDRQMLQQICDEEGAELFISTYYTTPINTPSVFMAYDMIPEVLGDNLNEPMWIEKHNAIKHASAFISISENTAKDLSTFFPNISLESITVAHCGVDPLFSPTSENEINAFKYKYGINKPYFLLGGLGGYKNSILFLQAFSQLINKHSFDIVATGAGSQLPPEWRQYTAGCTFHGLQLSDAELRLAYAGAVALVYPSQYEGFGMPVAEAMACGCPVITTPNASLPEVGGEAVIYVKDDDIEGMTNALCDVQKPSLRRNLIQAGLQQSQKFSWDQMADIVSNVLVNQTLESLPFNLGEINLIMFPDWNQSEDDLYVQLGEVIKALATDYHADETTLLIYVSNSDPETADGILSSIAMNLIMEDEIDITESIQISLIEEISEKQWQTLLPHLQSRVVLELENQEAIAKFQADTLPTFEIGL